MPGEVNKALRATLKEESAKKDFGNARGVRNLFEKAVRRRDMRVAEKLNEGLEVGDDEVLTLDADDFK